MGAKSRHFLFAIPGLVAEQVVRVRLVQAGFETTRNVSPRRADTCSNDLITTQGYYDENATDGRERIRSRACCKPIAPSAANALFGQPHAEATRM